MEIILPMNTPIHNIPKTEEAIDLVIHAEKSGANAALIVTPYYNKPTQEGLFLHYSSISEATKIPIIIYNIPGRSIVDMSVDTMARLSKLNNIIGVKDATNDLMRPLQTRKKINKDFSFLSGEDGTSVAYLAQGGHGCISVTANIAPKICADIQNAWINSNIKLVQELNLKLTELHEAMFIESSPGPVKYAASLLNLCQPETRLPLAPINENSKLIIKKAMIQSGLMSNS